MNGLTPQLVGLIAASSGVALMMALAGVQKNALEWRRTQRSCPSCGRRIQARVCARCAGD
jgi:hypothetical protein